MHLKREEAKEYILSHATDYFKSDKSGKGFICPICGSGEGPHGTGISENKKNAGHFTCWAGCFSNADIFEIIGLQYGLADFNEQFKKACEAFGVTIEPDTTYTGPSSKPQAHGNPKTEPPQAKSENVSESSEDFAEFFKTAEKNLSLTNYYRGISLETLKQFGVGFVPEWRHPKVPNGPTSPRLIIPNGKQGYLARDTRTSLTEEQKKFAKQRAGKVELFNPEALKQTSQPIFIVEGEFDALSIIDAGGQAVALCSTANAKKLIEAVKEQPPQAPLIISLDNDEAGREASSKLEDGLKQAGFSSYRRYSLPEPFKDANEFLMNDREGFREWIKAGGDFDFEAAYKEEEDKEREAFELKAAAYYLNGFMAMVKENKTREAISTGFRNLDNLLDGGLYSGLYFIGAVSSLGKTTLALQMADNIAKSGHGVLIFSLEMAITELIAKSLSRLSFIKSYDEYETTDHAKTTRGILRGHYTKIEREILSQAIQDYAEFGQNLHITEGVGNVGVNHIRAKTEQYIRHKGKPPIIVIDYLQILAAPEVKHSLTDKQVTDRNVLELKRISRDFDTPLIAISSFNRENYSAPVNMASFKESGAVEYSSDVLIGLQYYGWDYMDGEKAEKDTARAQRLRALKEKNEAAARNLGSQDIQLKVLKYRNGKKGDCKFDFFPAFNFFRES